MNNPIMKRMLCAFLVVAFLATGTPSVHAQEIVLPTPGSMVHLSPSFAPALLKGIKVDVNNPLHFEFILNPGDAKSSTLALKDESTKLIKYFLASLTVPETDLWVNLSPYEKDRIVPEGFGQTEMGRDLLAQDYILKQVTASLMYPEDEFGKRFWRRVYEEASKKFGNASIPINTFNKVWILPSKAVVYENAKAGTAYVVESSLKVMLEEDYLALDKNAKAGDASFGFAERRSSLGMGAGLELDGSLKELRAPKDERAAGPASLASQIVREIVIPELTKEINEGKNFAQLRQVYSSLILATWYKKKLKDSILGKVYSDKNKVAGININDINEKQKIYEQYLKAFKKGVYNYVKEEADPTTQEMIPRKYFSGGANLEMNAANVLTTATSNQMKDIVESEQESGILHVDADVSPTSSSAMTVFEQKIMSIYVKSRFNQVDPLKPNHEKSEPDDLSDNNWGELIPNYMNLFIEEYGIPSLTNEAQFRDKVRYYFKAAFSEIAMKDFKNRSKHLTSDDLVDIANSAWNRAVAGSELTEGKEEVTQRAVREGRNGDSTSLVINQEFMKRVRLDLSVGDHLAINVGAGIYPLDTIELLTDLKSLNNPGIRLIASELPQAAPAAHIHSRSFMTREFMERVKKELMLGAQEQMAADSIQDIFLVVNNKFVPTEVVVKYVINRLTMFDSVSVNPSLLFRTASIRRVDQSIFNDFIKLMTASGVSEKKLRDFIEHPERFPSNALSVDKDPLRKTLTPLGVEVTTDLDSRLDLKGRASIVMANNVIMHFNNDERADFLGMMSSYVKQGGILVVKNTMPGDISVQVYQRRGTKMIPVGTIITDERTNEYKTTDEIADLFTERNNLRDKISMYLKEQIGKYPAAINEFIKNQGELMFKLNHIYMRLLPDSQIKKEAVDYINKRLRTNIPYMPDRAMNSTAPSKFYFSDLESLSTVEIRQKIFGKDIDSWLALDTTGSGKVKKRQEAVTTLLKDPEFNELLKSTRRDDFALELIRLAVRKNINLYTNDLRTILVDLRSAIGSDISKTIPVVGLPIDKYVDLISALGSLQGSIETELVNSPWEDRMADLADKMELGGVNQLLLMYQALPWQISKALFKEDIQAVNMSRIAYKQLRSALDDVRVMKFISSAKFKNSPVEDRLPALVDYVKDELELSLETDSLSQIYEGIPKKLRDELQSIDMTRQGYKDFREKQDNPRVQEFLRSKEFLALPRGSRVKALVKKMEDLGIIRSGFSFRFNSTGFSAKTKSRLAVYIPEKFAGERDFMINGIDPQTADERIDARKVRMRLIKNFPNQKQVLREAKRVLTNVEFIVFENYVKAQEAQDREILARLDPQTLAKADEASIKRLIISFSKDIREQIRLILQAYLMINFSNIITRSSRIYGSEIAEVIENYAQRYDWFRQNSSLDKMRANVSYIIRVVGVKSYLYWTNMPPSIRRIKDKIKEGMSVEGATWPLVRANLIRSGKFSGFELDMARNYYARSLALDAKVSSLSKATGYDFIAGSDGRSHDDLSGSELGRVKVQAQGERAKIVEATSVLGAVEAFLQDDKGRSIRQRIQNFFDRVVVSIDGKTVTNLGALNRSVIGIGVIKIELLPKDNAMLSSLEPGEAKTFDLDESLMVMTKYGARMRVFKLSKMGDTFTLIEKDVDSGRPIMREDFTVRADFPNLPFLCVADKDGKLTVHIYKNSETAFYFNMKEDWKFNGFEHATLLILNALKSLSEDGLYSSVYKKALVQNDTGYTLEAPFREGLLEAITTGNYEEALSFLADLLRAWEEVEQIIQDEESLKYGRKAEDEDIPQSFAESFQMIELQEIYNLIELMVTMIQSKDRAMNSAFSPVKVGKGVLLSDSAMLINDGKLVDTSAGANKEGFVSLVARAIKGLFRPGEAWYENGVGEGMVLETVASNLDDIYRYLSRLNRKGGSVDKVVQEGISIEATDIARMAEGYMYAVNDMNEMTKKRSVTPAELTEAFYRWNHLILHGNDTVFRYRYADPRVVAIIDGLFKTPIHRGNVFKVVADTYYRLHRLHPFADDGNHRTISLLINFILMKAGKNPFYLTLMNFRKYLELRVSIRNAKGTEGVIKNELAIFFKKHCDKAMSPQNSTPSSYPRISKETLEELKKYKRVHHPERSGFGRHFDVYFYPDLNIVEKVATPGDNTILMASVNLALMRLGGLTAGFSVVEEGGSVRVFFESVRSLKNVIETEVRLGNMAEVERLMKAYFEVNIEILRRGVVNDDMSVDNYGVDRNGKIVLLDIGGLATADDVLEEWSGSDDATIFWMHSKMSMYLPDNVLGLFGRLRDRYGFGNGGTIFEMIKSSNSTQLPQPVQWSFRIPGDGTVKDPAIHSSLTPTDGTMDGDLVPKLRDGFNKKYGAIRAAQSETAAWNRPQKAMEGEIESVLEDRDPTQLNLLNLGSGDGAGGSLDIVKKGFNAVHVDFSEAAIGLFKERVEQVATPEQKARNQFEIGDMLEMLKKQKDSSFDIVHAHLSLQYHSKEKLMAIFKEIRRVLKPDGKFLFKVHSTDDDRRVNMEGWKLLEEEFYDLPTGETTRFFTEDFINQLLKDTGFKLTYPLKKIVVEGLHNKPWHNKPWVLVVEKDPAMNTGGIDFKSDKMDLEVKNGGEEMQFKIDPAVLKQLQDAPGLTPVNITIQPMTDLRSFLNLN